MYNSDNNNNIADGVGAGMFDNDSFMNDLSKVDGDYQSDGEITRSKVLAQELLGIEIPAQEEMTKDELRDLLLDRADDIEEKMRDQFRFGFGKATHNQTGSKAYTAWHDLVQRATNSKRRDYNPAMLAEDSSWLPKNGGFVNFQEDMVVVPKSTQKLGRICPKDPHGPGNSYWAYIASRVKKEKGVDTQKHSD